MLKLPSTLLKYNSLKFSIENLVYAKYKYILFYSIYNIT